MLQTKPIGLFDSGVGGTSIWKEIHALLPYENTLYLADSKHAPYGTKSEDEIIALSIKNTEFLIKRKCKMIVVACNTATTNAISILREKFDVPIIGIEPAIKPAALQTKTGSIGILATKGTLSSALFHKAAAEFTKDISVVEIIGEGLVPLIENGKLNTPELTALLFKYTKPMVAASVDYLVLGCSHYPYLIPKLLTILPDNITIIDSGAAVARQTKSLLEKNDLLNISESKPELEFLTNSDTATLSKLLEEYKANITIRLGDF
ncbi:MAG: glutamate racemase [Planctomycetota bacterium]|jgi:glutamate racemase|uniref:glutamate racemase n=1 Tax=Patiriisocius sp. Uisw_047 TaxID=3230969 RepID=UPI0039E9A9E0